jgi:plasmid replication initiation protein
MVLSCWDINFYGTLCVLNNNLTVYKSNQVVEASYKLSLNELRVVLACIAQVHSKEALLVTDEFELTAKDFADIFYVSEDRAYHALIDVSESLFNRYVVVENPYPDKPRIKRLKMRWISSIKYLPDEGRIILSFSKDMLPYLSELRGCFTKYDLKNIGKMTSIYGIRLYELLAQWQNVKRREVEVKWLKKQFEIEDLYEDMCDFKKRVIKPAVKDVNDNSNYVVSWTQKKTGRAVTHFTFEFKEKPTEEKIKKKTSKKIVATKPVNEPIDNLDHYADMRKRFGNALPVDAIPAEIIEQLKAQGRW